MCASDFFLFIICETLLFIPGHTKGLSSATYSPLTGSSIATVSHDNHIRLFPTAYDAPAAAPRLTLPHNNQTGRWLTTFKAAWHPRREDALFVGSMAHPRRIDAICPATGAPVSRNAASSAGACG